MESRVTGRTCCARAEKIKEREQDFFSVADSSEETGTADSGNRSEGKDEEEPQAAED